MTETKRMRRRLPARYGPVLTPLLLSGLMTIIVSAISTLRAFGFQAIFFEIWPGAWLLSWLVAFPVLLAMSPLVRWLVARIIEPPQA